MFHSPISQHPLRFIRFGGTSILGMILLAIAALPSPGADRPNILFAIADDASFPHMGAYGCSWVNTPNFDRVARDGLLFRRAYTPNAKCAPSRASILTGRNSWQLEEAANHWCFFPAKFKTFPEVLAENGYTVGYTAKGWAPGIALDADGKARQLTGQRFNKRTMKPWAKAMSSIDYAGNFEDFIEQAPDDQPWMFWYGGLEPHRSYEFGAGTRLGKKRVEEIDAVPSFWPDDEVVRTDMLDYAYEIDYFDHHLGRMLETLESAGQLDNTIVIVTSDNGMPFPRVKGQKYELSNHLPLAIMWPNGIESQGGTVNSYVSFVDFAPTLLELAGLEMQSTGMAEMIGESLVPFFEGDPDASDNRRDYILLGKERHDIGRPGDAGYPVRGIIRDDTLYLRNFETDRWPAGNPETGYLNCDGSPTKTLILEKRTQPEMERFWRDAFGKRPREEMYHVVRDPWCLDNLATKPMFEELKASLSKQMEEALLEQDDPRIQGKGEVFDRYPYAGKAHRGFYERYLGGESLKAGWVNPSDFESWTLDEQE